MPQKKPLYDSPDYDYQDYWQKRKYENKADRLAVKKLLKLIPKKGRIIDIGAGFGRLTPTYGSCFKECVLVDPSRKMLQKAKKKIRRKNVRFIRAKAEKLPFKARFFDAALMVRTLHHLKNPSRAIQEITRVLKPNGYLILEFPNKVHLKSILKNILGRKIGYFISHLPQDISTHKEVPFRNYHPSHIKSLLLANGFRIVKILSVSNFRHLIFKKLIPLPLLLSLESSFSVLISHFLPSFGPSIFILAQKRKKS
jgi:ubiquinone/menaquinone biosynthesis C-methylase UbiE